MLELDDAMHIFEQHVPWAEIANFLSSLIKLLAEPDIFSSRAFAKPFPTPNDGVGRPLPRGVVEDTRCNTHRPSPHKEQGDYNASEPVVVDGGRYK
jgi:hypothetical protein